MVHLPYSGSCCDNNNKNNNNTSHNDRYPEAMSLQETLRTFLRCQASVRPQIAPLLAERTLEIQRTVERAFKRSLCWEMDNSLLEDYVNKLHVTVMALHEQLGEVQERAADVQGHVDKLKNCACVGFSGAGDWFADSPCPFPLFVVVVVVVLLCSPLRVVSPHA